MQKNLDSGLIANLKLTSEERFIIGCLRSEFGGEKNDRFAKTAVSSIDWNVVYDKSLRWGVAPLMYKIIKNPPSFLQHSSISEHFVRKMKLRYLKTVRANKANFKGLVDILLEFNKAEINVILLKGSHLAQFVYQDIGVRPMCDIDIMVKKEELNKAEGLLFRMGYCYCQLSHDPQRQAERIDRFKTSYCHLANLTNPKGIKDLEVHWTIQKPNSPFAIDIDGLWKRAKTLTMSSVDSLVFSPEDLLLHVSLHASYNHELGGLIPFCDIAVIINHYASKIDWERLLLRANEWKTEKYLYLSLRLSKGIVGAGVPDDILRALKPSQKYLKFSV